MTRRELLMTVAAAAALPLRSAEAPARAPGTPGEALPAVSTVRGDESRDIHLAALKRGQTALVTFYL